MPFVSKSPSPGGSGEERAGSRDLSGLLLQLSEENPTARRWAARDLGGFPEASSALINRLKTEMDESVREVIFTSLVEIKDHTAVAGLVEFLRSEDTALRNEAIEALKKFPDEMAAISRNLLKDANPDVRILTINVLESLCHPDVEQWLIEVIERDTHVNVCAAAVDLLTEVGTESSRDSLALLLGRFKNEPFLSFAVELAIKRIDEA